MAPFFCVFFRPGSALLVAVSHRNTPKHAVWIVCCDIIVGVVLCTFESDLGECGVRGGGVEGRVGGKGDAKSLERSIAWDGKR